MLRGMNRSLTCHLLKSISFHWALKSSRQRFKKCLWVVHRTKKGRNDWQEQGRRTRLTRPLTSEICLLPPLRWPNAEQATPSLAFSSDGVVPFPLTPLETSSFFLVAHVETTTVVGQICRSPVSPPQRQVKKQGRLSPFPQNKMFRSGHLSSQASKAYGAEDLTTTSKETPKETPKVAVPRPGKTVPFLTRSTWRNWSWVPLCPFFSLFRAVAKAHGRQMMLWAPAIHGQHQGGTAAGWLPPPFVTSCVSCFRHQLLFLLPRTSNSQWMSFLLILICF